MKTHVSAKVRSDKTEGTLRAVQAAAAKASWSAAEVMLSEMQRRVPHGAHPKPGEVTVAASLQILGKPGDDKVKVGSKGAHKNRPVAVWLENGTHRQHARPFARPAEALGRKTLKQQAESNIRHVAQA